MTVLCAIRRATGSEEASTLRRFSPCQKRPGQSQWFQRTTSTLPVGLAWYSFFSIPWPQLNLMGIFRFFTNISVKTLITLLTWASINQPGSHFILGLCGGVYAVYSSVGKYSIQQITFVGLNELLTMINMGLDILYIHILFDLTP